MVSISLLFLENRLDDGRGRLEETEHAFREISSLLDQLQERLAREAEAAGTIFVLVVGLIVFLFISLLVVAPL